MNTLLNQELFNQDHEFAQEASYNISFNWYNLFSLSCSTIYNSFLQESTLYDVYWEAITDVDWNPLSVLERERLVYQKVNANAWIAVQTLNWFDLTNINVTSFESSLSDGWWVIDKRYWNKNISMSLFIQWSTHNDLIARIDDLKKNIQWIEWNLDITIAWAKRRYTATAKSITVPRFSKTTDFLEWIEVEFLITSPHWSSPNTEQVYMQNVLVDTSKIVENKWTYKVYPIIKIMTNTGSSLTWIWITHKNVWDSTWYTISIAETIPANTVVTFDYIEKIVTVWDTEVNFSWVMMPMNIWQSVFEFDFTWTIDVNVYIFHNPTYL